MISQEIKVDVREATDVGRRYSIRQKESTSPSRSGKAKADLVTIVSSGHKKAAHSRSEIEMKSMPEEREEIHSGATGGSAMIESGRAGEQGTFVDDLFAVCLDGR